MDYDREFQVNLLASSTAGLCGRVICHPLDTAKSRLQSRDYHAYKGTISALSGTFRQEGIRGLYRGFGAVVVGGVPGTCVYLTAYETTKTSMLQSSAANPSAMSPFMAYFLSGILAETVCCVIYVPVDVVKERLQVQQRQAILAGSSSSALSSSSITSASAVHYKGSWDAIKQIMRTEGLSGIYRGYGATLLSYSPFSALYFLLYEESKKALSRWTESSASSSPLSSSALFSQAVLCSAFAGATASYVTAPLDMAKLRLQIQRSPFSQGAAAIGSTRDAIKYKGMLDILTKVYRSEGIRGLFRGAGARVFFHTPSTAITMGLFEECKRLWSRLLN